MEELRIEALAFVILRIFLVNISRKHGHLDFSQQIFRVFIVQFFMKVHHEPWRSMPRFYQIIIHDCALGNLCIVLGLDEVCLVVAYLVLGDPEHFGHY